MTKVTAISGVGPKEPAAFLVEADGLRLLFDLGQGPSRGIRPDPHRIGRVDALVVSHGHKDHAGALDLLERIGSPPIYATRSVLDRIDAPVKRVLPSRGRAEVSGVPVETGRSGHALGGIWVRLDVSGGFLYMGDHTAESRAFAFDRPAASRAVIFDASYGTATARREDQAQELLAIAAAGPTHFPVPADGRGVEIAIELLRAGIHTAIDDEVRMMLRRLAHADRDFAQPGAAQDAGRLAETAPPASDDFEAAVLTSDAAGDSGMSARLIEAWEDRSSPRIIFTGHLHEGTKGRRLVEAGRAELLRWNVHPTFSDNVELLRSLDAAIAIPAFGDADDRAAWESTLAPIKVAGEAAFEF